MENAASYLSSPEVEEALRLSEYGFGDDEILVLGDAEAIHGQIVNWSRAIFDEALGALKGRAAFEVVRSQKAGEVGESKAAKVPARAPYLTYNTRGEATDYDPHDPAQFYTDPDTGEQFRWDGKGVMHRVTTVSHKRVGNTLLPDQDEALAAINAGLHWFHRGLNVWIGEGAKPLADPTPWRCATALPRATATGRLRRRDSTRRWPDRRRLRCRSPHQTWS
jgi:hypothetical protein